VKVLLEQHAHPDLKDNKAMSLSSTPFAQPARAREQTSRKRTLLLLLLGTAPFRINHSYHESFLRTLLSTSARQEAILDHKTAEAFDRLFNLGESRLISTHVCLKAANEFWRVEWNI
jgi:hypothetical protein